MHFAPFLKNHTVQWINSLKFFEKRSFLFLSLLCHYYFSRTSLFCLNFFIIFPYCGFSFNVVWKKQVKTMVPSLLNKLPCAKPRPLIWEMFYNVHELQFSIQATFTAIWYKNSNFINLNNRFFCSLMFHTFQKFLLY